MIFLKAATLAAGVTLLIGTASFAQSGDPTPSERVDAQNTPTTRSTSAEQAQTSKINNQVGVQNAAAGAAAATDIVQYQAQQSQYQYQLQQNQVQHQDYLDRTAAYNSLGDRYSTQRAAYHRGAWPEL